MRPVSLAAAVTAALGSTAVLAAPPTTPPDLRVDVYSDTAAELFWSRSTDSDGFVRGYEVRRDGQLVDTRDGLSYFTDNLTNGRAFAFTVTAVDFDGERSASATVSIVGGDRSGAVGSGGGRPTPPANLTSSVYSSSAAEVFWDRSDQRGLSYEVSVDGGPVTTTSGTSAFLSGLDGTRGRGVDVVAIDASGQRSGAANVTLGGGAGGGAPSPPSGGGDVPAPTGLRGELYSSTAGEVLWDRPIGKDLRRTYEVSFDDEVVATTDGTSYFVANRPGLAGTRVEVVAIGPGGARSSASRTTIGGGGTSNPGPDTGGPPTPANARIEVYSGTAAELFFDRATSSANVVETEISRDGEVIGSTNGTSFFDPDRTPGRDYVYELVAVNGSGLRSGASTVGKAMTPPQDDDLPGDVAARLEQALSLFRGTPLEIAAGIVERFDDMGSGVVETSREAVDLNRPDATGETIEYACANGGTVNSRDATDLAGLVRQRDVEFSSCRVGAFDVTGYARRGANPVPEGIVLPAPFTLADLESFYPALELDLVDSRDGSRISLGRAQAYTNFTERTDVVSRLNRNWASGGEPVTIVDAEGRTTLADIAVGIGYRDDATGQLVDVSQGGGVELSGEGANGLESITVPVALERDIAEPRFTAGTLQIDGDGFRYVLEADNGDPSSFQLTVETNDTTSAFTVPWSDRFDLDAFLASRVDLGFGG